MSKKSQDHKLKDELDKNNSENRKLVQLELFTRQDHGLDGLKDDTDLDHLGIKKSVPSVSSSGIRDKDKKDGYKLTKLGWIPEDWHIDTIGNSLTIKNNKRKPISEEVRKLIQGDYPYYGPTKVQDYINEYQYEGEYALIAEDGDHFLKYRDFPMTQLATGKFNVNNHAHVIRGTNKCKTKWFYWFYNRRSIFSHLTRQGAGRYKLNKAALSQLSIAYPSISEQNRIILLLDKWDKAIHTLTQLIAQKELRKKGLVQQLLTGKKRLPGFGGEWEKVSAGQIFENISIKNSTDEPLLSVTQDQGVIPRNMLEARVTMPSGETGSFKLVQPGNFVISLRSFQGGLEYSEYRGLVSPAYTVLQPIKDVDSSFYKYYFKSYDFIGHLAIAVIGIRDGKQISYSDFCTVKIPDISKDEQTAIAQMLQCADREITLFKQKLSHLKDQKKGLMQQLLTGKKRLNID